MKRLSLALMVLASSVTGVCCATEAALRPPPGYIAANKTVTASPSLYACPAFPEPHTGVLDFPSKFEGSDSARDDLNESAEQEYRQRTADVKAAEKRFSKLVEEHIKTGTNGPAACAVTSLATWADAQALLGTAKTHTGKSVRKWALGSFASAYLLLKYSSSKPLDGLPNEARRIEAWFAELATHVIDEWETDDLSKINNHEYWAAWSVIAVATVVDDHEFFDWALGVYRTAAQQIDEQGFLPNELSRNTRALFYHNYALPPLAMIAAFAQANQVALIDEGDGALQRLAGNVVQGLQNPERFARQAGAKQRVGKLQKSSKFTWMEPYCWLLPCPDVINDMLQSKRPLHNYRVGGDVSLLFAEQSMGPSARVR